MRPKVRVPSSDADAAEVLADLQTLFVTEAQEVPPEEPELILRHPEPEPAPRAAAAPQRTLRRPEPEPAAEPAPQRLIRRPLPEQAAGADQPPLLRRPAPEPVAEPRPSLPPQSAPEAPEPVAVRPEPDPDLPGPMASAPPEATGPHAEQLERARRTFSTESERPRPRVEEPSPPPQPVEPPAPSRANADQEPAYRRPAEPSPPPRPVEPPAPRRASIDREPEYRRPAPAPRSDPSRFGVGGASDPSRFGIGTAPGRASESRPGAAREPRLTDTLTAGLRQANRDVQDLISANRSAYVHLFGAAGLPARPGDSATAPGTAADGQLVGTLSELRRSVDELDALLQMLLPRI